MSKIDLYYRKLVLTQFFTKGWGRLEYLNKIVDYRRDHVGNREACLKLLNSIDTKFIIEKESKLADHIELLGYFESPFVHFLADFMPNEIKKAKFQMLIPKKWNTSAVFNGPNLKPVCIHLAGTGDHFFWRRRFLLAKPLITQHSVASIILENPFYGYRKPETQTRSSLQNVADLYMMGAMLVGESFALMKWCEKLGYGPFVLSGLSMGGHMASLATSVWPKPVALVPCLSWTTASPVFTRGVMSESIPWALLESQYNENKGYRVLKEKIENQNILFHSQNKYLLENTPNSSKLLTRFSNKLTNYNQTGKKNQEILYFMQLLMDECTHLLNFDKPIDPTLVYAIAANDDAYVLRDGVQSFSEVWPGSKISYLPQGHVSAFLFSQPSYIKIIMKMLNLMIDKHYS